MLDNFTPAGIREAAKALRGDWVEATGGREGGNAKRALVEVSGGLTEENMEEHLCDGELSSCPLPLPRLSLFPVGGLPSAVVAVLTSPFSSFPPPSADVDILSTSSIHQGTPIVDFSMKLKGN